MMLVCHHTDKGTVETASLLNDGNAAKHPQQIDRKVVHTEYQEVEEGEKAHPEEGEQ